MYKAYKVRLYPNQSQSQLIDKTIGCVRFIYNTMLNERITVYNELKDDNDKLYTYIYKTEKDYKVEFEWLKEVSSRALQQSHRHLEQAFQNWYKGLKKGNKKGFPKFKSRKKSKMSYTEPQIDYKGKQPNAIEIIDNKIKLNKLHWVTFRGLNNFEGKIVNVTVSKYDLFYLY